MKTCPCCGHSDNPFWRSSKFELNADYMDESDFEREYPDVAMFLPAKPHTLLLSGLIYYRRGKKAKKVYRVPVEDYKVETEKHGDKFMVVDPQQQLLHVKRCNEVET